MVFEKRHKPLLPTNKFLLRALWYFFISILILLGSLGIGMIGYHHYGALSWVDSFLNASMILTGMGPVDPMKGEEAKIFAGIYALFSGIAFLTIVAVLFAPIIHRFFHVFHLDMDEEEDKRKRSK
jgi:hypothetical protein